MRNFLKLLLYIFYGLPVSLIIIILRPIVIFRFQQMMSERIGHFTTTSDLYLCEKLYGINMPNKYHIDIFCFGKIVSNLYIAKKWKTKLRIFHYFLIFPIIKCLKILDKKKIHQVPHNLFQSDRDTKNLLDKTKPFLKINNDKIKYGYSQLSNFGINNKSKFVCVIDRNNHYLKKIFPLRDFESHNSRILKIESFYPCFVELTKRGYFVIRMGPSGVPPVKLNNKMVIDYANSKIRSDFMDVFIGAKCTFHIRTNGYGGIPTIFRKPILDLCPLSFGELATFCQNDLLLIKDHFCLEKQKILSFEEIFSKNLAFAASHQKIKQAKVELRENPLDIKNATIEMIDRIEKKFEYTSEEMKQQNKFWYEYEKKINFYGKKDFHGLLKARFSKDYLKKKDWFN